MIQLWRYLFRENPMQIETTRAIRRFTVSGGYTPTTQKYITWTLMGMLYFLYAWFLLSILRYGEDMSMGILWFELGLLTLFVPGSLYAAISGERERLTWDSLILTNLSPARILIGKLLWRLTLAGILLLAFLPPLLLTHFMPRFQKTYTLYDLLYSQAAIAAWVVFLAAFTVWASAKTKRSVVTLSAVTVFLLSALFLIPATFVLFGGYTSSDPSPSVSPLANVGSVITHLNPILIIPALAKENMESGRTDYWRDFLAMTPGQRGLGIYTLAPFIYLLGAGFCLAGTLRALARLGLPARSRKGQG